MITLTRTRQTPPYRWVHTDEDDGGVLASVQRSLDGWEIRRHSRNSSKL